MDGMNPQDVEQYSKRLADLGELFETLLEKFSADNEALSWVGVDADQARQHWKAIVAPAIEHAANLARAAAEECHDHAHEQRQTSAQ